MNPADFLDVARQFQASAIEAERRTSIGRSYYAVYNILIGLLSSEGIFSMEMDVIISSSSSTCWRAGIPMLTSLAGYWWICGGIEMPPITR